MRACMCVHLGARLCVCLCVHVYARLCVALCVALELPADVPMSRLTIICTNIPVLRSCDLSDKMRCVISDFEDIRKRYILCKLLQKLEYTIFSEFR